MPYNFFIFSRNRVVRNLDNMLRDNYIPNRICPNNMADGSRKSLMPFVHNGEQFCTLPNWILAMCEITRHCLNTNGIRKIFLELVGHNRRTGSQFRHKNNYLYKVLMFLYLYLLMNLSYTIDIEIRWRFDNISINLLSKSNRGGYIGGNIVQITFSE